MKYKYTPSLQASQEYNMIITMDNSASRCPHKWRREYKDESSGGGHNQFCFSVGHQTNQAYNVVPLQDLTGYKT